MVFFFYLSIQFKPSLSMKSFLVRFYLVPSGALEVVIQAKNGGEAERIVKLQYGSKFKSIASTREI